MLKRFKHKKQFKGHNDTHTWLWQRRQQQQQQHCLGCWKQGHKTTGNFPNFEHLPALHRRTTHTGLPEHKCTVSAANMNNQRRIPLHQAGGTGFTVVWVDTVSLIFTPGTEHSRNWQTMWHTTVSASAARCSAFVCHHSELAGEQKRVYSRVFSISRRRLHELPIGIDAHRAHPR